MNIFSQDPSPAIPGKDVTICLLDATYTPAGFTLSFGSLGTVPLTFPSESELCVTVLVPVGAIGGIISDDMGYYQDETMEF